MKPMEKLTVLLIDFVDKRKSSIFNILNVAGFTVIYSSYNDFMDGFEKNKTDLNLLLFRISNSSKEQLDITEKIKILNLESKIPVIILSSSRKIQFFLDRLEDGFCHFITTPINKDRLISRIEFINKTAKPDESQKFDFDFLYKNKNYKFDIEKQKTLDFMMSALENATHQNKMLVDSLHRQNSYKSNMTKLKTMVLPGALNPEERKLEEDLWKSLENNDFRLYYQPVVSLETGIISGFESLVRWVHPGKGFLVPDLFIPVAEKSPIIIALGFWIVEEAVKQIKVWNEKYKFEKPLRVNINLSTKQFIHPELSERIIEIVDKYDVDHESIAFEITESAFMEDMESANLMLLKLKSENFKIYMDDFGTGYSSLNYLLHFPVDVLKIDKSFVQWMHIEEQSEQIVKSVIYLAHNLNMKVVTEGVESLEQLELLKIMNSDYGQGYYYSPPLDAEKAELFIQKYL
jgi:EAL domain-containing protein (putative c-di-GMP-specific phosphodiesterase class I)/DNA-binding response OmpR family regulator